MISLLQILFYNSVKSAINNPLATILIFIGIIGGLWGIRKQYLIHHPFILRFYDKNPYYNDDAHCTKRKSIEGINGLFADHIFYLEICLKKELTFEQINIRLVKKKYFSTKYFTWKFLKPKLWNWENTGNEKMVYIEEITSLDIEHSLAGLSFLNKGDLRGGKDGFYKPSYSCPQNGYLYFKVKLYINPEIQSWEGYLSFKHNRGGAYPPCVRGKLTIKNINLEEKECPQYPKADP